MHLLQRIDRYLRRTGVPITRFGREAMRDPRFISDLRRGREPRPATVSRVQAYLDAHEPAARG